MTVDGKTVPLTGPLERDEGLMGIRYAGEVLFFSCPHVGEAVRERGKHSTLILPFFYGREQLSSSGQLNTPSRSPVKQREVNQEAR